MKNPRHVPQKKCSFPRMPKEEINLLPLARWEGPTHLVRSAEEMLKAATVLSQSRLLGFDTETRPAFKKGEKFLPSILQLATGEAVYVFQLQQLGLPEPLVSILSCPHTVKAGVAPNFDLLSLQDIHPFQPEGFVDLARIARRRGIANQGLRGLAAVVCGIRISKSMQTTNWANRELTPQQIQYAATDAWVGREIYCRLELMNETERTSHLF